MFADEEQFINSIKNLDRQTLEALCLKFYAENKQLVDERTVNDKINTEMYIQHQEIIRENKALKKENKELKAALEKEISSHELLVRSTFDRKTEKMLAIVEAAANKKDIPEDEAQEEETTVTSDKKTKITNISSARDKAEDSKKTGREKSKSGKGNKAGKSNPLKESLKNLPTEIIYDLDTEELDRKHGKGNWRIAFWHKHVTIERIDQPFYVKEEYTPVISVGLEHELITIPYENLLRDRSIVSPSLMAYILYCKFVLSLPWYRQAMNFLMQGIDLSKQTIINWANSIIPEFLGPVEEYLTECLLKYKYTQNDETYIHVNKGENDKSRKGVVWVHASSQYSDCNPIVIFCYEATRNTDHLRNFYKEFMGYLTCDAYVSYQLFEKENKENITVSGCMMHCRRYFAEAFFVNDIQETGEEELMALPETQALFLIRDIYLEENKLKDMSATQRLAERKEKVAPKVNKFFGYVHELADSEQVFPERLEKAITYAINQEEHLKIFLTDGNICIDNGHAERVIRAFSVGRANWLFADTVFGAQVNTTMYSIVETAKANGVNVLLYLRYLLEEMPKHKGQLDRSYLKDMVPWSDAFKAFERQHAEQTKYLYQNLFQEPERPRTPRLNCQKSNESKEESA